MADNKMQIVITALDDTQRAFAGLKQALNQAQTELKGINAASGSATTSVNGLGGAFSKMQGAIAALGLSQVVSQLHQAGMAAEKLRNSFEVAAGGTVAGGNAMAFVRGEANRLGLDLQTTAQAYMKLTASSKGTALEGQKTQQIFTAVATAGRALSLSADEMDGALRAISQMMSKGTVQSEELRGQLGERLPGAFQIAARSMGVSTAELGKMLEQGKVVSDDFLPKFAAELQKTFPAGEKAVSGLTAETERLKTAWFQLKETVMASGGEGVFTGMIRMIKRDLESVRGIFTSIQELYQTLRHPFTKRQSAGPGQPLNTFDASVMGLGTGSSVDTSATDWMFNNKTTPTPFITSQQISADSVVVKDRAITTDEKKSTAAARKAEKDAHREAEAWRKAEADDIRDRYKFEQDQIKLTQKEHDAWQKAELADVAERKKYARQELANQESALTLRSAQIAEQEAAGTITATEAMSQQLLVMQQKSQLLSDQLTTMPKDTAEEVAAYNSQAEALSKVNTELNGIQRNLRLREGWEGLKQGLQEYADMASNVGQQIQDAVGNAFKGLEDALVNFVQNGKLNFKDLADSIMADLIRIAVRSAITKPLAEAAGSLFSGFFAQGGAFVGGVQKFATGGIVMSPTLFGMSGGAGLMGEAGPEAIMPLTRTSSGHLGVRAAGGGQQAMNVQVNVINQSSQNVSAKSGPMQFDGKSFVINTILQDVQNNGPLRGLMAGGGAY
jgi:lambda family phage tail tape measure protein